MRRAQLIDERLDIHRQGLQSKEEGKAQESIQSSTTPDPRHHMEK